MRGMKELLLKTMVVGMMATNCYLAKNRKSGSLLILDPGDSCEQIIQAVTEMEAAPEAILLTHGHFDHIGAAAALKAQYGIPICALDAEQEVLTDPEINMSSMYGKSCSLEADRYFSDREDLMLAGFEIQVLHTPGHTVGSACYYLPQEAVLFSGDTLFYGSVGRPDFPTGSMMEIHRSIHERLFVLPEETDVFPGHDAATTIKFEKKYNPY